MNLKLYKLENNLKIFLLLFVIILTIGISVGLVYLYSITNMTPENTIVSFTGSRTEISEDEFDIPDEYAKPISEMLLTTHVHVTTLSPIFFIVGLIFYFNALLPVTGNLF